MNRQEFGQRGELREPPYTDRIIGAPGGRCLCPGHGPELGACKNTAVADLFIRTENGNKLAVCGPCYEASLVTWEEILAGEGP